MISPLLYKACEMTQSCSFIRHPSSKCSFIDPRKIMLGNEERKAKGLNQLIKAQLPLPPTAHAFDCGSKCIMLQ